MNLSYPAYLRVFFPAAEVALVRGSVGPWSNMAKKGARAWEMDVFWKVGWWWSFIVHHNFCWCIFFSLKFARCVMWVSKIVNHPDLPFLFFLRDANFFGFAKIVPAAFRLPKKLLVRFVPAMLRPLVLVLVLWPAMGEVTCSEETTLVQRRHRTTRGRNISPKVHAVFEL